jgi:hypothetical protein
VLRLGYPVQPSRVGIARVAPPRNYIGDARHAQARAIRRGCNNNSTNPATINWFETGVWIADKTANNAAMNSNQHRYWNF